MNEFELPIPSEPTPAPRPKPRHRIWFSIAERDHQGEPAFWTAWLADRPEKKHTADNLGAAVGLVAIDFESELNLEIELYPEDEDTEGGSSGGNGRGQDGRDGRGQDGPPPSS